MEPWNVLELLVFWLILIMTTVWLGVYRILLAHLPSNIKSKYHVLTPVIRQITSASNDRKQEEHRIKILLKDLDQARKNLANAHDRFTSLVRQLVNKKDQIDKSYADEQKKIEAAALETKMAKAKIELATTAAKSCTPVTSTPIKLTEEEIPDDNSISTFVSSTNNEVEDMDVCNSDETDIGPIDIVDPNDIDQIFSRKPTSIAKSTIPEYVSPLNFNYNSNQRYHNVDPLGIMCPYEVNGSCRDIDCMFKHYLRNDERL